MAPYCEKQCTSVTETKMAYLNTNAQEFDEDEATNSDETEELNDEDNTRLACVYPPPPNVLPESLPLENSLPQLLISQCGVTEEYELVNRKQIKLRIISKEMSLQRLSIYMPALQELDLSGSWLQSLRDLGCNLKIKILKVSSCGLDCLDGLFGLSTLQELHAEYNSITDIGSCAVLPRLQLLNLSRNQVRDLGEISFLAICCQLRDLNLSSNPVCDSPQYRNVIMSLLPHLEKFDGENLAAETNESDTPNSDEITSNTSDEEEHISVCVKEVLPEKDVKNITQLMSKRRLRPSTSGCARSTSRQTRIRRPHTAQPNSKPQDEITDASHLLTDNDNAASALTSGSIVCGNLTAALRSRSRRKKDDVWCNQQISESENLVSDSNGDIEERELIVIPEDKIRQPNLTRSTNERLKEVNGLLEASRNWRQAYEKYRESVSKKIESEFTNDTEVETHVNEDN